MQTYLVNNDWVHANRSFACRGDSNQVMPTYAEPTFQGDPWATK